MRKTEVVSEILVECLNFGDALEVLGYALEFISCNTDIDEGELRLILNRTYGGVKCLANCHGRITSDIENLMSELLKEFGEAPEPPEQSQKYREELLVWVYRHMDAADKGQLDSYIDGFHLGFDYADSSVVKGQGEADTP